MRCFRILKIYLTYLEILYQIDGLFFFHIVSLLIILQKEFVHFHLIPCFVTCFKRSTYIRGNGILFMARLRSILVDCMDSWIFRSIWNYLIVCFTLTKTCFFFFLKGQHCELWYRNCKYTNDFVYIIFSLVIGDY